MSNQKTRMIKKAEKKHKKIYPCAHKLHLKDCFTRNNDFVFFWYNTEDHSTHVITETLRKKIGKVNVTGRGNHPVGYPGGHSN